MDKNVKKGSRKEKNDRIRRNKALEGQIKCDEEEKEGKKE